jgi:homoserine acetyltransferase
MRLKFLLVLVILFLPFQLPAQKKTVPNTVTHKLLYPAPAEGNFIINNFRFGNGEVLPELKLHYTTIGTPVSSLYCAATISS